MMGKVVIFGVAGHEQDGGKHSLILMHPVTIEQVVAADRLRPIIGALGGKCPNEGFDDSIRIDFPSRACVEQVKAECIRIGLTVSELH
jgi:hypothetical protein